MFLGIRIPDLQNIEGPLLGAHTQTHTEVTLLLECLAEHGLN